jgi:hypothetical protein
MGDRKQMMELTVLIHACAVAQASADRAFVVGDIDVNQWLFYEPPASAPSH